MAVSYLSQSPIKSSAYVPPVDLSLYAHVLSIKQEQYDLGAKAEQASINQLGNLDVRPVDKPYLNDKINNLVSTINNFGGQDYGDPNVLNQIEGLGADIYGDQKVLTAVSSMKQVRNLSADYEKYKTDPKLSKFYAPQNEYEDMSHVNQWMNNPEVGAAYTGPSSPTPYVPWRDNLSKIAAQTKADKYSYDQVSGFYIDKVSGARVTPDRIVAEAEENLLPQERDQMNRDGNYLYKDTSPDQIIQKGIYQVNQRYDDAKTLKDYYDKQADASSDPEQRMRFITLSHQKAGDMASLAKDPMYTADAAVKAYQANPKEFVGQVYRNEAFKGLADVYSYNQSTTEQKPNTVAMYMDRKAQAEKQFDEKMLHDDQHFYEDLNFKYFKEGQKMIIDPKTGAISSVPLSVANGTGGLQSTTINTQDPSDLKVTNESLKGMNDSLELEKQNLYQQTFSSITQHHPELGHIVPSLLSPTGHVGELYGQEYLEWYNGKPGLQPEDLAVFEKNPDGSYKNPTIVANYQNAIKAAGQDPTEATKFMSQQYQNYQTVLNGQGHTIGDLNPDFLNTANTVQLINVRQNTIKAIQDQAKSLVGTQAGWSKEQTDYYFTHKDDDLQNVVTPSSQDYQTAFTHGYSGPAAVNSRLQNLREDLKQKSINTDKIIQSFYDTQSTRDVFQTHVFANTEGDVKNREAANFIHAELAAGRGGTAQPISIDPSKIKPIQVGKMSDGSGRFFMQAQIDIGTEKNPVLKDITVPLSSENAAQFNLATDPAENINYAVNSMGTSGDLNAYGDNNIAITYQIQKKNLSSLNDISSFSLVKIYSKDQNGNIIPNKYTLVPVPGTDAVTPADAFRAINTVMQNAASLNRERIKNGQPPGTQQDFYNWIINYNKTKAY